VAQYTSDDRTNEITNKRRGQVTQVIVNVLSPPGSESTTPTKAS